ncbi:hypothetical protein GQ53DRAFT_87388 [Thozetella sp. PMI_491]|nr:hypothetical protein GQ53DRAFT_87388 [Thozetella sp. PMI_491]
MGIPFCYGNGARSSLIRSVKTTYNKQAISIPPCPPLRRCLPPIALVVVVIQIQSCLLFPIHQSGVKKKLEAKNKQKQGLSQTKSDPSVRLPSPL